MSEQLEDFKRKFTVMTGAIQSCLQSANLMEGVFDARASETKTYELKRDKLKSEFEAEQKRTSEMLTKASEEAAGMRKDALRLLAEAKNEKIQAVADKEESVRAKQEAAAIMAQAIDKQRNADNMYRLAEEKLKKIESVMRIGA